MYILAGYTFLLFNFNIDHSIDESWLSYGVPTSIAWELMQDIYVNTSDQFEVESVIDNYNMDKLDIIPISLQRQVAKKKNTQWHIFL